MVVYTKEMATGYLELIVGPMFSGKTTSLVNIYNEMKDTENILVVNYSLDTRYDSSKLSTHDKVMIPCEFMSELRSNFDTMKKADVILINEGQFFPDIKDVVIELVETHHKKVYICGLDGDFKRNKFGELLDLLPYCDNIKKLTAKCDCGKNALFSHRLAISTDQVLIGSTNYVPLCRRCYQKAQI